jgi:hypothetical protein
MKVEHFAEALAPLLKDLGFKKQRFNWRKDLDESIAVLNVQISSWGDRSYYVNVGIYLKALGEEVSPPHNRCHDPISKLWQLCTELAGFKETAWFSRRWSVQCRHFQPPNDQG